MGESSAGLQSRKRGGCTINCPWGWRRQTEGEITGKRRGIVVVPELGQDDGTAEYIERRHCDSRLCAPEVFHRQLARLERNRLRASALLARSITYWAACFGVGIALVP